VRLDLVEQARRGDRDAFDVLMLDVIGRLYAIARLVAQDADRCACRWCVRFIRHTHRRAIRVAFARRPAAVAVAFACGSRKSVADRLDVSAS
jgi:hypothetical protein